MEFYRIACVLRPHGVQGAVKLKPLTDSTARFVGMQEAYLEQHGKRRPVTLLDIHVQPDAVRLRIAGIQTKEDAELLRGAYLCVDKAHAVKLPPDTYFIADLIGCEVFDTKDVYYGKLIDVLQTGANDVYVVEGEKGMLLPALKKVLAVVDTQNKRICLRAEVVEEVAVFAD